MAATLDDAWAKVEWAYSHFRRLQAVIQRYLDEEPFVVSERINPEGTHRVLTARAKPAPPEVPFVLGDLVHALHSALDYVVCSLVESVGQPVSTSHGWPIFSDRSAYDRRAPRLLHHVPQPAIDLIESLQPYNDFDYALGVLYDLSVEEKHRALLVASAFPFPKYVAHSRPADESSGIGFRRSAKYDEAYIDLPIDPANPDERFDPHFETNVTLVRDGPDGPTVEDVGAMLYNDVAHHVMAKVAWLNLLPLTRPRALPTVWP